MSNEETNIEIDGNGISNSGNVSVDNSVNSHTEYNGCNFETEKKPKFVLEKINERFRNFMVDYIFGFIVFVVTFASIIKLGFLSLAIPIIIVPMYLFYLPRKFPFMYIYVYEDRLRYFINKEVLFDDIKHCRIRNNGFYWRLRRPKERSITLYNNQNSFFIYDAIERYNIATNTKLY